MVHTTSGFSIMKSGVYSFANLKTMGTPSGLPLALHHTGIVLRSALPGTTFSSTRTATFHRPFPCSPSYTYNPTPPPPPPPPLAPFTNLTWKPRHAALWILNRKLCRVSELCRSSGIMDPQAQLWIPSSKSTSMTRQQRPHKVQKCL